MRRTGMIVLAGWLLAAAGVMAQGDLCDDLVAVEADEAGVHVRHTGALYNCCPLEANYQVALAGERLEITETMVVTDPCRCVCCTDLLVDVALAAGIYELHYRWRDDDSSEWQEHVEVVVVPGPGNGPLRILGDSHACGQTVRAEPRTWGALRGLYR